MKIGKYNELFTTEEPKYEDFVTRRDFINTTGIFVTPVYFTEIYDDFKKTGVEAAEFVRDYESKYSTCIQEFSADGDTIKFELCDDSLGCLGMYESDDVPNVLEILNSLALEHYDKWVKWGQSNETFAGVAKEYEELGNEYKELGKELSDICLVLDQSVHRAD